MANYYWNDTKVDSLIMSVVVLFIIFGLFIFDLATNRDTVTPITLEHIQEELLASQSAELERISTTRLIKEDQVCDSYNNILENEVEGVVDSLILGKYYPGVTPVNIHTFSCLLGQKTLTEG